MVNPNNILQHNAVAGSTHFGFWYRVLQNPDGPSRTNSYCPAGAPMGRPRVTIIVTQHAAYVFALIHTSSGLTAVFMPHRSPCCQS